MTSFYDDKYQSDDFYWGTKPSPLCYRVLQLLPPDGKRTLLDLGCGEGRNAIFFARNGYDAAGFDVSIAGVNRTVDWAADLNLSIEIFQADLNTYRLRTPYDIIFASGTLHYIPDDFRVELINHYKEHTNLGGLNAFNVPVQKPFLPPDPDPDENGFTWLSGEILTHYHDWKIEYFAEEIVEYQAEGFPSKFAVNRIIASKPAPAPTAS